MRVGHAASCLWPTRVRPWQGLAWRKDTERNERESLLLRLAEEFIDFLSMEEQFPSTERFVIHEVAMAIGTDMAMVEKDFAALYAGITIL